MIDLGGALCTFKKNLSMDGNLTLRQYNLDDTEDGGWLAEIPPPNHNKITTHFQRHPIERICQCPVASNYLQL